MINGTHQHCDNVLYQKVVFEGAKPPRKGIDVTTMSTVADIESS
jgi:hypothetical protein